MTRPRKSFRGGLAQFDAVIAATGSAGAWEEMPAGYWRFRRADGAILNWWPSTGTFNFQGQPAAAKAFERELVEVVDGLRIKPPALTSSGEG
ncbi:MAG TPA: hypothetical protein VMN38_08150 [Sphingomicrobium sp.]|nr:hypothetical protein [Sphingomicrobium sp.]